MKKTFVISLILVSILFIGSIGMALAKEVENCQLYLATVTTDPDTALPGPNTWQECIEICYEDGFAEASTCGTPYYPYEDTLILTLEDFGVDSKNLVGFSEGFLKVCHVKLRGGRLRILEADCLLYDGRVDGYSYFGHDLTRIHVKGKAVNECEC
jgi:hypothetical protein